MSDKSKIVVAKVLCIGAIVSLILIPFTNAWSFIPFCIFGGGFALWFIITI